VLHRLVEPKQYTSIRYGERLADLGATASVGTVGDAYDNALAEATNGLYKTELIRGPGQGPWRTVEDVELATLSWVHWYNTERLHEYISYMPPAEFERKWTESRPPESPQRPAIDVGDMKGADEMELIPAL
jgi:transposase InsO family protein